MANGYRNTKGTITKAKIIDGKFNCVKIIKPILNNTINKIIEFLIDRELDTKGLFCVLRTLLSMSRSSRSLIIHPAERMTIDPIKKIINKLIIFKLRSENAKIEKHIG